MEDLIKEIQERTGLSTEKVLEVVTMVTEYLKNALPDELVEQVTKYLGMAAEAATGATDTAKSAAASTGMADLMGKAAGFASSALSKASSALAGLIPDDEDEPADADEDGDSDE